MDIFHITQKTTLKDIKTQFYDIAMWCHPDQGGCAKDMQVLYERFIRAKEELAYSEDSNEKMTDLLETLERGESTTFDTKFPTIREIFDDAHSDFHQSFEQKKEQEHQELLNENTSSLLCDDTLHPYIMQGYGNYMLNAQTVNENDNYTYNPNIHKEIEQKPLPQIGESIYNVVGESSNALLQSNTSLPSTMYPVCVNPYQHIQDFSVLSTSTNASDKTISMYDYRHAFMGAHESL